MQASKDPIIEQFLAGRALGPIGMDELATEQSDIEKQLVEREVQRLEAGKDGKRRRAKRDVLTV
jgi:hypothetical protein